ncbi:TPA: AAA family ATPase [Yersinia enterocolitica]
MSKLILKNILAYSINGNGIFSTEFGESVNIIHGRNTSGKSTLMQSILYSMGVNDSKENLNDIISENVIFRLECEMQNINTFEKIVFVRLDDTLVVRIADNPPIRFDGINGNNSFEYGRYKELFNKLFNFKLRLQKQADFTNAPIEAAFLPFYISQSVGWVYLRESIGDYRFYKDFKFDYLDYYTGLKNRTDRLKKYTLKKEKQQLEYERSQLIKYKSKDNSLKLSETLETRFKGKALDYLKSYDQLATTLISEEANHDKLCNKLSMLRGREKVLLQTIRNLKLQKPRVDRCPVCEQTLPGDIRELYIYTQDINDALREKEIISDKIKTISASLNSVEKKIKDSSGIINNEYRVLKESRVESIGFESWINHHANITILGEIKNKERDYDEKISGLQTNIDNLANDAEIDTLRYGIEKEFLGIFQEKAKCLEVKIPDSSRYKNLYSITSFPYQGVELHKIIMAYHFSFYQLISKRTTIHKFPFLLDAVFKEDIDVGNREIIFNFLSSEAKNHEQILFSVAEYKKEKNPTEGDPLFNINEINNRYFSGSAKQICIGNAKTVRSFLLQKSLNEDEQFLLDDAFSLLQTI